MGSRVELFAAIRRDARIEDPSIRELAERHHVHRRNGPAGPGQCVAAASEDPGAGVAKAGAVRPVIDGWLLGDLDALKKQPDPGRNGQLLIVVGACSGRVNLRGHPEGMPMSAEVVVRDPARQIGRSACDA
jgi:hypothetical protein